MENKKQFVVTPDMLPEVFKQFLDKLKEKEIVASYMINKDERRIVITFNPEAEIPDTKEELITIGLFRNDKAVLKDLGYEDIDLKTVMMPMYSTQEEGDSLVVNY